MKRKLSVTVEENLLCQIDEKLSNSLFRNKSHLVEVALQKYLEEKDV